MSLYKQYEIVCMINWLDFPRHHVRSSVSSAHHQDRCAWENAVYISPLRAGSADGSDTPWEDE